MNDAADAGPSTNPCNPLPATGETTPAMVHRLMPKVPCLENEGQGVSGLCDREQGVGCESHCSLRSLTASEKKMVPELSMATAMGWLAVQTFETSPVAELRILRGQRIEWRGEDQCQL